MGGILADAVIKGSSHLGDPCLWEHLFCLRYCPHREPMFLFLRSSSRLSLVTSTEILQLMRERKEACTQGRPAFEWPFPNQYSVSPVTLWLSST